MTEDPHHDDIQQWNEVMYELRNMAAALMRREGRAITMQSTILVNECWMRMQGHSADSPDWSDPEQFFGYAHRLMKQILVDYARQRNRLKRGGEHERVPMEFASNTLANVSNVADDGEELVAILDRIEQDDPQLHEVIWLRFAYGFTVEQVAQAMGVSLRTAAERWRYAKARIRMELREGQPLD
ncbi:MAG: ECF-type sigma factor [Phycisphaerales bacterium]|nr:ECF-type sigma factor [Phycisphaerales bacterium]